VGKSTLARHTAAFTGLPVLPSATASAREGLGYTFDDIFTDVGKADTYQSRVFAVQTEMEAAAQATGFVSDRAFDLMAYTARLSRVLPKVAGTEEFKQYMLALRNPRATVFFVRPHEFVQAPRDGRRDQFLCPRWQWGVDGVIEFLLEMHEVPRVTLEGSSLKDKVRTVEAVLWKGVGVRT
jgi:hypothetical protein